MPVHGRNIVYIAVIDNTNSIIFKVVDNKNLGTNTTFKMSQKAQKHGDTIDIFCQQIHIYLFSFLSVVFFCTMEYMSTAQCEKNITITSKNRQKTVRNVVALIC